MEDLLGYRKLLGVIAPSSNTVAIADASRISLTGVTAHQSDFIDGPLTDNPVPLADAIADAVARIDRKAPIEACLFADEDFTADHPDLALGGILRALGRSDIASPYEALQAAVDKFGAGSTIAVITPFTAEPHRRALASLKRLGLNVVADASAGLADSRVVARTGYIDMRALYTRIVGGSQADLVVQLGHNLPMARLVDNLEEDHGRPVLAINSVCIWHLLRRSGIFDPVPGAGILLLDH